MAHSEDLLASPFALLSDLVRAHARERPGHPAIIEGDRETSWRDFDALVDRAAAALQRDGGRKGAVVAICAATSLNYVVVFIAALRVGAAASPLAPSATADQLAAMVLDSGASVLFLDSAASTALDGTNLPDSVMRIALEGETEGSFGDWLEVNGSCPAPVSIGPQDAFNIIYSSGTTGAPKGIVQPHIMRWGHVKRSEALLYGPDSITVVSTPLYSNTTLVSVFPTLARGGTLVLMRKFDVRGFLEVSAARRATHAMLVPVQYRRLMDHPDFEAFDLSSYRMKTCTSAPFSAELKADILRRWPGGLTEIYGMTEGGGSCLLRAHEHPDKLHTVGRPAQGHDIRIIDDNGVELAQGKVGEVVGRSMSMMSGYHNLPDKTEESVWISPQGDRFIRTGDVGRFDEDGFLILADRKKDMIITGGFNVYPSDLEAILSSHPSVADCAVVGVPSRDWGETPAAFVMFRPGYEADGEQLRLWVNGQVGKTQRLSYLTIVQELPRSSIGKVLKRQLRDGFASS